MRKHRHRGMLVALAVAAVALALAACGSSSSGSKTKTSSGSSTSSSSAKPGAGKPAVVLGDKNFTEEYILGALYQQALEAKGYKVTLKGNIGSTEITYKALQDGQIQMYPEYDGTLLTTIYNDLKPPTSAAATYSITQKDANKQGFELTAPTPFADADGLATTKAYAKTHRLTSIADVAKLGKVSYGAPAENRTRYDGLVGLEKVYGLHNLQFVPLAEGLNYKALDSGQVDVATIFTTDPQLQSGKYTVLKDTKGLFGFQNVAMVLKPSLATAEGPAFVQTINKVSALLTLPAIIRMNAAVALDQQQPTAVAKAFLKANGLL